MRKPKIIGGYQNTKLNKEDFAITPYLFLVCATLEIVSVYGIGLCWDIIPLISVLALEYLKAIQNSRFCL